MSNGNGKDHGDVVLELDPQALLSKLMQTDFFQQFSALEGNLHTIAHDLKALGSAATQRIQETESLAVHVLATEAMLLAMMKKYPVSRDEVLAVANRTTGAADSDTGNPAVINVIEELLAKAER